MYGGHTKRARQTMPAPPASCDSLAGRLVTIHRCRTTSGTSRAYEFAFRLDEKLKDNVLASFVNYRTRYRLTRRGMKRWTISYARFEIIYEVLIHRGSDRTTDKTQ
jgi:hypothetical protein